MQRRFKVILLLSASFISRASFCQDLLNSEGFKMLRDFEVNKSIFTFEIWDWNDSDGDYGALFKSNQRSYWVFDLSQFREKSRHSFMYLTDTALNVKIVRVVDYNYDKRWDDPTKSITITTQYFLYEEGTCKRYDSRKKEINDSLTRQEQKRVESFFAEATGKSK